MARQSHAHGVRFPEWLLPEIPKAAMKVGKTKNGFVVWAVCRAIDELYGKNLTPRNKEQR